MWLVPSLVMWNHCRTVHWKGHEAERSYQFQTCFVIEKPGFMRCLELTRNPEAVGGIFLRNIYKQLPNHTEHNREDWFFNSQFK